MQIEQLSFELTQKAELTQKMKQHQMNYEQSNTVVEQTQKSFKLDTKKKIENNTNQLKTQTNQLENYNQILKITDKLQDGIMVDLKKSKETLLTAHEDTNTIQSDVKERALQVLTLRNILLIYYKI